MQNINELSDESMSIISNPMCKNPSNVCQSEKSHSKIDNISLDSSKVLSEEEKNSEISMISHDNTVNFVLKPKLLVILLPIIEKLLKPAFKIVLSITGNDEISLNLKENTRNLRDNFNKITSIIEQKIKESCLKIISHSNSYNELKNLCDSKEIKELMKTKKHTQLYKYSDFRDICEKLNQNYGYSYGLEYFKEKTQKKPRFLFLYCLKDDFQEIFAGLKEIPSYKPSNKNNSNDVFCFYFPKNAEINEKTIENLLENIKQDKDFLLNFSILGAKLSIEITNLNSSKRKIKAELQETLRNFNLNSLKAIKLSRSHYKFFKMMFINGVADKYPDYGIKMKVFAIQSEKCQNLSKKIDLYRECKKYYEKNIEIFPDKSLKYFLFLKGNQKAIKDKVPSLNDFIGNISPKLIKISINLPIKTTLQDFYNSFLKEEIILILKNNCLSLESFDKISLYLSEKQEIILEIPILHNKIRWPFDDNSIIIEKKLEDNEKIAQAELEFFLKSIEFKYFDKTIQQIEQLLKSASAQKITNFQDFLEKYDLFHEEVQQKKLCFFSKNRKKLTESFSFLNSLFSVKLFETREISIEKPVIFFYLTRNSAEIKELSVNCSITFEKSKRSLLITSQKEAIESDCKQINSHISELSKKIITEEFPLELCQLKTLQAAKLEDLEFKYQCQIDKFPATFEDFASQSQDAATSSLTIKISHITEKFIHIVNGDIFEYDSELLIIPVDENLLFNGGIALKLKRMLDIKLTEATAKILQEKGKSLEKSECVLCGIKGEKFKKLMFVVSPAYKNDNEKTATSQEYKAFIHKMLELCNINEIRRLTLPILGAGNNQLPIKHACKFLLQYLLNYLNTNINCLQEISIIEKDSEKFLALINEIDYISQNHNMIKQKKTSLPTQLVNNVVYSYKWSWNFFENGDDFYEEYDIEVSQILEESYNQKLTICDISGLIAINYPTPSHLFDFNTYLATHVRLGTQRKFARKKPGVWIFEESGQNQYVFSGKICEILENFYENHKFTKPLELFINNYKVDLQLRKEPLTNKEYFIQENIDTGFKRKVRRTQKKTNLQQYVFDPQTTLNLTFSLESSSLENFQKKYNLPQPQISNKSNQFIGLKISCLDQKSLKFCFDELTEQADNLLITMKTKSNKEIEEDAEALKELADHLKLQVYMLSDENIVCKGLKTNILQFFDYIHVKYMVIEEIYPLSWEKSEEFHLHDLEKDEKQFKLLEKSLEESMDKTIKVHKITKIENQKLWLNYVKEKKKLLEKYQNYEVYEENLYYKLDDCNIIESIIKDHGINRQGCAKNGILGEGIYLGKQAKTFHSFGFLQNKNAKHQIIICKTLMGVVQRSKEVNPNRQKLDLIVDSIHQTYDSLEYTSSQGTIVVIFDDNRVYPEYLLEYSF